MLEDEIREKERTILEIMSRLDIHDEEIAKRIESKEYQSLLKKTFREWSGAESEDKRTYIRNILANAAASSMTSDEVVRLFIDWLKMYSELHFKVIAVIYKHGTSGVYRHRQNSQQPLLFLNLAKFHREKHHLFRVYKLPQ